MGSKLKTDKNESSNKKDNQHRKRFTEGLLNIDEILEALNIRKGQKVLDAGCGTGYMSKIFAKEAGSSGRVYALDTDRYFIKKLGEETQGTNIEAIVGDITGPTGIEESSLDLIYISMVIHSFSRRQVQGFLQETGRLLKPHGLLAIVEIEKKETLFGPPLESRYSPEELKAIIPLHPVNRVKVGEHFYMQIFENKNQQAQTF